jgi:hypothetical protein
MVNIKQLEETCQNENKLSYYKLSNDQEHATAQKFVL